MTKKYVVGFLFSDDATKVGLILKNRPDWQKGKWNGIGGKLEFMETHVPIHPLYKEITIIDKNYETPFEAMVREFKEETGVEFYDWTQFAVTSGPSEYDKDNWEVHYFKGFSSDAQNNIRWVTDEMTSVFRLTDIPNNLVAHNNWLIPLALNSNGVIFHISEEMK